MINVSQLRYKGQNLPYLWKKEWVRPFESFYSIARNFCKINVLDGLEFYRIFFPKRMRCNSWMPGLCFPGSEPDAIISAFVPEEYLEELKSLPKTSYNRLRQYDGIAAFINHRVRYCPICEKEGYHSYLHVFRGIEECLFHKVPLVPSTTYFEIIRNITYDEAAEKYQNCRNLPLPFERNSPNERYRINFLINAPECIVPIYPNNRDRHFTPEPMAIYGRLMLNSAVQPSRIFHVISREETREEHEERFVRTFNARKIPKEVWSDELYRVFPKKYRLLSDELEHLAKIYAYGLVRKYGEGDYHRMSRTYRDILYGYRIVESTDEFLLRSLFIWQYIGASKPIAALSSELLVYPNCGLSNNFTCSNIHAEDAFEHQSNLLSLSGKCIERQIMAAIHKDYFFCLFRQFRSLVKEQGSYDGRFAWEQLTIPVYFAIKRSDDWEILRFNHYPPEE